MGWEGIAVVLTVVAAAAVCAALYAHIRTRNILNHIDSMLESAINGNFTEQNIDESLLSEVECKMSKYLSASELSARNVVEEKKILHTLISDISHQTKTPLANIKLYTELLKEAHLQDENRDNVERLYNQTEKLEFLIHSLVRMSRLETGILVLEPRKNTLDILLSQIKKQYAAPAEEKGLDFVVESSDLTAVFDEKWTAEAIGNIVDNAIKYTAYGSVRITVAEYEMFRCIQVADTGRGIREAEQGKIFGRFCRSADVSKEEGLGIGLYMAREIIRRQNGYIKLVSEEGNGACFQIYLPTNYEFFQN